MSTSRIDFVHFIRGIHGPNQERPETAIKEALSSKEGAEIRFQFKIGVSQIKLHQFYLFYFFLIEKHFLLWVGQELWQ